MSDQVEFTSITQNEGVEGIVVVNSDGIPIRSTLEDDLKVKYASLITQLISKARSAVKNIDKENDLTFFRMRTKMHEILVAPDKEYLLIVIQKTTFDK
mmetsp:Transcript_8850/g.32675  ORF Transcript_8850/g.32675 Transcript_8850/m.32675 type:complete len:98 (-) Transcript_8850:245-538(-)|eukprot:CAMPEP_0117450570 /NCGR_PEP_ID=MMETSP0759-20121206/8538_1 /TAXON_ID=63605 /ORGANISM="Percolomonas cosmopolitus, Strain WS" /LENGTH=97 /DNA_ID=CAMNT_0005243099 /DNA_START=96 /DNA_END=389 /DNA_ORIENTATION=-